MKLRSLRPAGAPQGWWRETDTDRPYAGLHILLIESTWVRGFDIVEEMADAGIEVTFVSEDLARYRKAVDPARLARAARLVEVPTLGDGADLHALLRERWGPRPPDGVICRSQHHACEIAALTRTLGLRGESAATAALFGDKAAARERLAQAGLGSLRWRCIAAADEALDAAAHVGYPLVVKPVAGSGSVGVTVVDGEDALLAAVAAATQGSAVQGQRRSRVLLEEFVPGRLVSAELLVQRGEPVLLGFSERDPCPSGVTAETGGHFPARFDGLDRAREFAFAVVRALDVRDCAVHMEMMITPHGPELIEVNGRVAGHVLVQQMSRALGRSVGLDLVAIATGRSLAPVGEPVATVALRQLWSDVAGTVEAVAVPADLGRDVVLHEVQLTPGTRVSPLQSNRDRFGFVLAEGLDVQQARENAAAAAQRLLAGIRIVPLIVPLIVPGSAAGSDGRHGHVSAVEAVAPRTPAGGPAADPRTHVLLVDRGGPASWTRRDGSPLLPPERYRLSIISSAGDTGATPCAAPDLLLRMDIFDHDAVRRQADAMHAATPLHRIVTRSERVQLPVAQLRRRFGLEGETPVRVNRFIDKAVMKTIARGAGIRHAAGGVLHSAEDLRTLQRRHERVVVKPRASSGSDGVSVLADAAQCEEWLARTFVPGQYLGERFIDAPMVHIDALVFGGEIVWDVSRYLRDTLAYTSGAPLSSQTLPQGPARAAAHRLLLQVVDAWEIEAAVLHLEAFATDDAMTFCEVACRPGGAGIVEAFEATRGINLAHAKILLDVGDDPRRLRTEPVAPFAGWTMHYTRDTGVLTHYDDSAVADAAWHKKYAARPGQAIAASLFSGSALSTHTFARASDGEVTEWLRRTERSVTFEVREPALA
jgi:biotin carboxylase